jgi:heme-degrading monooxygenase HmoA
VAAFEATYGARGEWARFFAQADGYKGTEMLHSTEAEGEYLIIDRWTTAEAYRRFLGDRADEYKSRSARTRELYLSEERLGAFVIGGAAEPGADR